MSSGAFVGLISGTSMDGIDAVVAEFVDDRPQVLAADTMQFSADLRAALDRARADPDQYPSAQLARLDAQLGAALAAAASRIIEQSGLARDQIIAIGSHGQTVLHRADADPAHTLQIGDPTRIVEQTGCTVVADFRRADLAAGGQGAPLAPLLHRAVLASDQEDRLVINLGGIANVTQLPRSEAMVDDAPRVSGFDTGPANCLIDDWYRREHPDAGRFDVNGDWARTGQVDAQWLEMLLKDGYFHRTPPKSTGIEYFSPAWLSAHLPDDADQRPADIQATLSEFTAVSLAAQIERFVPMRIDRMLLCGGGVHNRYLLERLQAQWPQTPIESTEDHGMHPDHVEALLFAWLARERIEGRVIHTPPITGAQRPLLLGAIVGATPTG
ncbi:MAG: anhydro-N-acetylmuramic acid kinase [Pseudomonadota bacterium]